VRRLLGLGLAGAGLAGLVLATAHASSVAGTLTAPASAAAARADDRFSACVAAQVGSVVRPGEWVTVSGNLGIQVDLARALGPLPVTVVRPSAGPHAALTLVSQRGPATCRGQRVVALVRRPGGRLALVQGTGARLGGSPVVPPGP
jgi:hypothetical protein